MPIPAKPSLNRRVADMCIMGSLGTETGVLDLDRAVLDLDLDLCAKCSAMCSAMAAVSI